MSDHDENVSRRQALAAGAGLAALAAVNPASGQEPKDPPQRGGELRNPFTQYPRPPFPAQSQPARG